MVAAWRADGARVALVPTMGALHDGHAALIRAARAEAERVVVSIFVNPRQFGPNEDFDRYPRDEAADVTAAARAGADLVYAPAISAMYPSGYATTVSVAGLSEGLCGAQRPGHFDGMATVVTKLFLQAGAESAWFGEKDYQQWLVVRRLVADLDIPVRLRAVPTVREADGLALSSRNRFLSPGERAIAPLLAEGHAVLTAARFKVEYLEIRDAETLAPCTTCNTPARVLAAVRLGSVRLIDNWPIPTAAQRA